MVDVGRPSPDRAVDMGIPPRKEKKSHESGAQRLPETNIVVKHGNYETQNYVKGMIPIIVL